ncbi:MAG: efflux RND transporter permease subunit, partial [Verrucomicrobia bacterium]
MIASFIDWSLRNRFLVLCAALILVGWGFKALRDTPVDAIPDLSENQVLVYADWTGRGPQEVEDQVTYPISVNLQGLRGVRAVRATSMFGFSLTTVVFEDRIPPLEARQRVTERLNLLGAQLPPGVTPLLGPDATGLGWVYQYYLHVDTNAAPAGYDLGRLRSIQDFNLRQQLQSVPGVAEVASIGGFLRQYSVEVNPTRLRAAGVSLAQVMDALLANHLNVGGKTIEENGQEFLVRGLGLLHGVDDIADVPVADRNGVPIRIRDVAVVEVGGDFRRGALDVGGEEAVGGIVIMRNGENAMAVIERVKTRLGEIGPSLPPGVVVRPFYDRSDLIARTIATLKDALVEEVILVTLAHVVFLFHFRSILIVTVPLPLSILVSFLLMRFFGITSNIMSLSGIAIAIGVLVDAGIVMTENVIRHCEEEERRVGRRLGAAETMECTRVAARQVGRPIFFAMAIIILAFV